MALLQVGAGSLSRASLCRDDCSEMTNVERFRFFWHTFLSIRLTGRKSFVIHIMENMDADKKGDQDLRTWMTFITKCAKQIVIASAAKQSRSLSLQKNWRKMLIRNGFLEKASLHAGHYHFSN